VSRSVIVPSIVTMPAVATIELRPDRFAAGGEAIAKGPDGRVVFVRGALPGEVVVAEVTHEKRDWARAQLVELIEASPDRVEPPCESRRAGLHDAAATLGPSVDQFGYRTTVRVAPTTDGRAGFRGEQSHEVVAAPACLIAHPVLQPVVAGLSLDDGVEPTLRYSIATGEIGARWDRARGEVRGLPEHVRTGGAVVMHEDVAGRRLQVSIGSFFQSGPQAAELLVAAVKRAAPELAGAAVVVDAYAGIGMFAACVTHPDAHVIAIETSRSAVDDAHENLDGRRGEIVRGEVGGWHAPEDLLIDVIVADPARSGLGQPGTAALVRAGAPVLVLVSCDPASLGRDTKLLHRAGYVHERSEVLDTFPHTTHIEVVSRFVQASNAY
jgi:23S rRNA (uracil1939-C5)-methyltransferase